MSLRARGRSDHLNIQLNLRARHRRLADRAARHLCLRQPTLDALFVKPVSAPQHDRRPLPQILQADCAHLHLRTGGLLHVDHLEQRAPRWAHDIDRQQRDRHRRKLGRIFLCVYWLDVARPPLRRPAAAAEKFREISVALPQGESDDHDTDQADPEGSIVEHLAGDSPTISGTEGDEDGDGLGMR